MSWLFDLTPHQLDVLKTLASIAGGIGGFLSGVTLVYSRLGAKNAKQAVIQTATQHWVDGKLKTRSVAETGEQVLHKTEEFRGEITHLANPPVHGRRRLPTTEIPTGESNYE